MKNLVSQSSHWNWSSSATSSLPAQVGQKEISVFMRFKYKNDFLKSKGFSESRSVKLLSILVLVGSLFSTTVSSPQQSATSGLTSIRADELREKVVYIASRELKGRGNGSPELRVAAEYIAGVFRRNGIKPAGDSGTFFQNFRMFTARLGSGNNFRVDN